MTSIFSTYKQGENRVTSTIIEVLRNLPINVVERFLGMFIDDNQKDFFQFQNQIKGAGSIPDAEISSDFKIVFETKTARGSINETQLGKHLELLDEVNKIRCEISKFIDEKYKYELKSEEINRSEAILVYLTPDHEAPALLNDKKVVWKSFKDVYELINELFDDPVLILSERDQFLLRNLQEFFEAEGLLPLEDEVVIVAASTAWPLYEKFQLYICQNKRSFRKTRYMGFYANGGVKREIAPIIDQFDDVEFTEDAIRNNASLSYELQQRLLNVLAKDDGYRNHTFQVTDLKENEENALEKLDQVITNDLTNDNDRGYAYTQGQRYTTLENLRSVKTTGELKKLEKK